LCPSSGRVVHEKALNSFAIIDVDRHLFVRLCECVGAKLQGGMGPTLVGKQFWLTYGGKKVSTLWSEVHTEMPMTAPGSVSAKNSTNIMAFLLQKNGVPAGTMPLDDTADLSKVLPSR
jgi:polar amino acid transport system substrate-binding protein